MYVNYNENIAYGVRLFRKHFGIVRSKGIQVKGGPKKKVLWLTNIHPETI